MQPTSIRSSQYYRQEYRRVNVFALWRGEYSIHSRFIRMHPFEDAETHKDFFRATEVRVRNGVGR
jgi:hypothetical protein